MKLTTERLKQLIKEELDSMQEIAMQNPTQDPIAYLNGLIPKYAKGHQSRPEFKKEFEKLKQDIMNAKEAIDKVEKISFPVEETYREAMYGNIIKAIDIHIKDSDYDSDRGPMPNFSTLRSYLRDIDERKVNEVYMIRTLEKMGYKIS